MKRIGGPIVDYVLKHEIDPNLSVKFSRKRSQLQWSIDDELATLYQNHSVYDHSNSPWAAMFNGVRRALQHLQSPAQIVSHYFTLSNIATPSSIFKLLWILADDANSILTEWKQYVQRNIDDFPPWYTLYLGFESFPGYPKLDARPLTDDPFQWLTKMVEDQHDAQWWRLKFTTTFSRFVRGPHTLVLTLKEFLSSPWLWTTDGRSSESRLFFDDELVRSKFAAAVSIPPDDLEFLVYQALSKHSDISVFVKPDEKGFKRRLIANPSLGGYLLAAYVRYVLEEALGSKPQFMTASTTPQQDMTIIRLLRGNNRAVPLDESAYDYHVSRQAWQGFVQFLLQTFEGNEGIELFSQYALNTFWTEGKDEGPWLKGMPSGLALTSLLNTWINYIKQMQIDSPIHFALGDDVLVFPTDSRLSIDLISQYYTTFGAEVNVSKNWQSHKFAEYLKYDYSRYGKTGIPARVYSSLMWALDTRVADAPSKLQELAELWKQFYDRSLLAMNESVVAADLSRAISARVAGFSASLAKSWLHSPRLHGGFGKLPYNNLTFRWKVTTRELQVTGAWIRIPRPNIVLSTELQLGTYHMNQGSSIAVGSPYRLPPVTSVQDWERRLNREDLEVKGPFRDLALDVIPLPTVDFVSTATMSNFAHQYRFNVYAGLHGSWSAIASRLVRTSLLLASAVQIEMLTNDLSIWL